MHKFIEVRGARENNLKNIHIKIPHNNLIVITGVSGSGKSSLAYDTLYLEGQRRYVESLSAYARQFLGKVKKPDVDLILGLPPAIAIEQKVNTSNPWSTVGTTTEIYDYLKLLFANIGKTYSPVSGKEVKKHTVKDVTDFVKSLPKGQKLLILAPVNVPEYLTDFLKELQTEGFLRVKIKINGEEKIYKIHEAIEHIDELNGYEQIYLVIDRLKASDNEEVLNRVAESANLAFERGDGVCIIEIFEGEQSKKVEFSNRFEADGITFQEPSVHLFTFTNPLGACPVCKGFGNIIDISEDLVIPDKNLSVAEGAVAPWRGAKMSKYKNEIILTANLSKFPIYKPYKDLTEEEKNQLWYGTRYFTGIYPFFKYIEKKQDKIQYRVMLSRYRSKTVCRECKGTRLRKEAGYVKINGKSIQDLVLMQISDLKAWFENLVLPERETKIAARLLTEIKTRLEYLCDVGLGYLTLNRSMRTLSGGETQRINLATILGSGLLGSLYVLDEPTIGLHPRDTHRLIKILKRLKDLGNTVMVVEHDEAVIRSADYVIDMGPLAGHLGGEVVFFGKYKDLLKADTLTAQYLTGKKNISTGKKRRKPSKTKGFIRLKNVWQNNLKNIDVEIPLGMIVAITGVSGSGKSSLINQVLYPAVEQSLGIYKNAAGKFSSIDFDKKKVQDVQLVDQNPIGKSTRSNPVTYLKIYDLIRQLFANQPFAKINGFTPSYFSFNVDGGRCEVCQGEGVIRVEMQFMADVTLICDACNGKRFKDEILEVKFKDKNIYDILEMTVDQAYDFFSQTDDLPKKDQNLCKNIAAGLDVLRKVGLGYIKLGQSSSTLSGGENQRVKLASFLLNGAKNKPTLYIFDEPTVGLHFDDVKKLALAMNELIANGHSVIFIEHNLDLIKIADWIIDLGPEGGDKGGEIVFTGPPEEIINCKKSYTGKFLKEKLLQ